MKIYIVIPVYNEEKYLRQTLQSFVDQTHTPYKIVIVNDNSTDRSQDIIDQFTSQFDFIEDIPFISKANHAPGTKVINAFYHGYESLDTSYDLIGKFDADIILPKNYFETIEQLFTDDRTIGIAGGNLYISKKNQWIFENISKKTKVRGPIKLYRNECFYQIGGLKKSIGWDTVDELLARFHGWEIKTDTSLHVKHLRPTGATYNRASRVKQGQAFKKMRYGFWLTLIASLKLAWKKNSFGYFWSCLQGYFSIKNDYIVSVEEGKFIRDLRWKNIRKKFF